MNNFQALLKQKCINLKIPVKVNRFHCLNENSEKKEGVITFFIDSGYSKSAGKYRFLFKKTTC